MVLIYYKYIVNNKINRGDFMYKRGYFKYSYEVIEFLNANKIKKDNIISLMYVSFGEFGGGFELCYYDDEDEN